MFEKIRKNSSKKINDLINSATYFTIETKSMGYDDCVNSNGEDYISKEDVLNFIEEKYDDLLVRLYKDEAGNKTYLSIKDGIYYFCDEVFVYFTPRPIESIECEQVRETKKPKISYSMVKKYLENDFVSPLNSGVIHSDIDTDIQTISIKMTECPLLDDFIKCSGSSEISLDKYNELAWLSVCEFKRLNKTDNGYYKTILDVELSDTPMRFFHQISCTDYNLGLSISRQIEYQKSAICENENVVNLH